MFHIPTRQEVLNLKVGDTARDCFGKEAEVTEIYGRGVDAQGKWYVCYYTKLSNGGISGSMKEDELMRSVELSKYFTSWQLDDIETAMLKPAKCVEEVAQNVGRAIKDAENLGEIIAQGILWQAAQHAWERRAT